MAKVDSKQGLKPSILDRLIDPESGGTAYRPGYGVVQMLEVVRRDLEDLLNTRQTVQGLKGLQKSIYCYGFPDLTNYNGLTPAQREEIGGLLSGIVFNHEPRLRDVQVEILEPDERKQSVQFKINASLAVEPFSDVAFHTVLELTTGHYSVKQTEQV